ncbi:peptidase S8 [Candidatus Kaiserbacteria bacterium CG10_big_fil_rev_8_21_14_0_10_59_10]|uniref:Peptidase S8 n=1 Tax=Candidatus Kaiserbacteria bacterium CG10_big_fil_rev_8_21_14_0_10_59_10 TaxID=1974612 RepID=A0A2H0U7N7_9BACT|nr:MAG: peptidase S8 [Candidatus Kaiserbacteria bacterium CG10_big_fil_rev_8_21_14_0_10_59_10]
MTYTHILTRPVRFFGFAALAALLAAIIFAGAAFGTTVFAAPIERTDVLIGFKNIPGFAEHTLVRAHGGAVTKSFHLVPAVAASLPSAAIRALERNPLVSVVEIDGEFTAIGHSVELDNTWGVAHVGAGSVHHDSVVGTGIKVAIIDTGIDYTHSDLGANYAGGHDFVNGDNDPMDDNGHGTHVAGTAAALLNGAGVVGAAPEARLYGLKVLNASGSGSFSDVIAALQWAVDNGVSVTNNSYGSSRDPGTLVQAAFDNSAAAGVLHIAAAGNEGNCPGNRNTVGYPARYASVVAVAATDKNDKRPCFSSTGPDVELSAPGVSITSTYLGGSYATGSGTSMASPHVAGVAALVMAAGEQSASAVRQILRDTAKPLGDSNHYGHGLIQAVAAVAAVGDSSPPPDDSEPEPEPEPAPEEPTDEPDTTTAVVSDISYSTSGGRTNDRHLTVAITISNGDGAPIGGATVSIDLHRNGSRIASGTGTTNSSGVVSFTLKNAQTGCYSTTVTDVVAEGAQWDGFTPSNEFCK